MERENKYSVLLYYCYAKIENPELFREEHHRLCLDLNLRGRIIVAEEGLNGTVSGLAEDCEKYMAAVLADPRFGKTDFKVDYSDRMAFQKMHVRVKPEIVHSSLKHIKPYERTGVHLEPEEFKQMKDQEDVVILDVRSNYEHGVGKFKNAVTLDIDNFRDFPEKIKELEQYKDKKVLTYCTGGIKCEKASAFLLENGFENVYQLHGGIIKYGMEAGGEDFEGKCYVFDNRVVIDVNTVNPTVISKCYICGTTNDRMVNCANPECNIHVPICEDCGWKLEGACSEDCKCHPEKRPYNGSGYYAKELNGYNPVKGLKRKSLLDE
jgi:UPF0176 protein